MAHTRIWIRSVASVSLLALGCGANDRVFDAGEDRTETGSGGATGVPPVSSGGVGAATSDSGGAGRAAETSICPVGQIPCDGECVSVSRDSAHCGACGTACAIDQSCVNGQCVCQTGRTICSGTCVDLQSDGANCGRCGVACPEGQLCSVGTCGQTCSVPGQTACGRSCVDLMSDPLNCGACGAQCATTGQQCIDGSCACQAGLTLCGTICVDTATSPANCGSCGAACSTGQSCQSGTCAETTAGTGGALGTGGATGEVNTGGDTAGGGVSTGGLATGGVSTGGRAAGGASTGGRATGGVSTGGLATGGVSTGGASTGGNSGSRGSYPCDGDTSGYNATAIQSGGNWTVQNGGGTVYTGSDMESAMVAAYESLSRGRSSKESVLIQGSGDVSANAQISIPSYTIVNVCGTINVTGSGSGDRSPMHARGATDIDVPNVTITGAPIYAMFFRETNNVHLGNIVLDLDSSAGRGLRIDHSSSSGPGKPYFGNYQIDSVYVSGSGGHGVETYGIENITIGEVVAENTGYCGLLLNYTRDAEVGSVTGRNCGAGTGYAAFRIANQAGPNIHVGEVHARDGGRGIFSVSESGGLTVDRVDIADTGSNAILLEDCHDTTIAAESGTVAGPGDIRIAGASSNVTVQNLTVVDSAVNESPCGSNITVQNNTYNGSSENICD